MNNLLIIIIIIIIIYTSTCNNKELFTSPPTISDDVLRNSIFEVYQADVRGIQNLAGLCSQLLSKGLTIPGNVTATGQLNIYNNDTNNVLSFNKYRDRSDINSTLENKWGVYYTTENDLIFKSDTYSKEVLRLKASGVNILGNLTLGTNQVSNINTIDKTLNIGGTLNVTDSSTFTNLNILNTINLGTYQIPTDKTLNVGGTFGTTSLNIGTDIDVKGTLTITDNTTITTTASIGTNPPTTKTLNIGGTMEVKGDAKINNDITVGELKFSDLLNNLNYINSNSNNTLYSKLVQI